MALSARDRRTVTIGGIVVGVLLAGFVLFSVPRRGRGGLPADPSDDARCRVARAPRRGAGPADPELHRAGPLLRPARPLALAVADGSGRRRDGRERDEPSPSNGGGGGTQTPSPTAPGGGSSRNVGGSTVVLLDIFQRDGATHAQVEVDGTVYDVVVGEQFAGGRFELRSVGGNCATFLFGDEQFTLCINAQK